MFNTSFLPGIVWIGGGRDVGFFSPDIQLEMYHYLSFNGDGAECFFSSFETASQKQMEHCEVPCYGNLGVGNCLYHNFPYIPINS